MKLQKPILHGRDHACGGADPLPGYCLLLEQIAALINDMGLGGDYTSVQTATSTTSGAGSIPSGPDYWPSVVIADVTAHLRNGYALWAHVTCTVKNVARVILRIEESGGGTINSDIIPSGDWPNWTHVDFQGQLQPSDPVYAGPDWLTAVPLIDPTGSGSMLVTGGVFKLSWYLEAGDPPATATGSLWNGSYPIVDPDIATGANISPTKLAHPGTTTVFLRGDGTYAQPVIQVEY